MLRLGFCWQSKVRLCVGWSCSSSSSSLVDRKYRRLAGQGASRDAPEVTGIVYFALFTWTSLRVYKHSAGEPCVPCYTTVAVGAVRSGDETHLALRPLPRSDCLRPGSLPKALFLEVLLFPVRELSFIDGRSATTTLLIHIEYTWHLQLLASYAQLGLSLQRRVQAPRMTDHRLPRDSFLGHAGRLSLKPVELVTKAEDCVWQSSRDHAHNGENRLTSSATVSFATNG